MSATDVAQRREYGTIVVVGGGCYGSYYVRQLHRAVRAGALQVREIVVVDRDANCQVSREPALEEGAVPRTRIVATDWRVYFEQYLTDAALSPAVFAEDAIVPSPLMPHLMAEWLVTRTRTRWPERTIGTRAFDNPPETPWSKAGEDGVHYVSFATWMCPVNCVEPRICPHTRDTRTWSVPTHLVAYANDETAAGRPVLTAVLHCRHRAYGVGMFDTSAVTAADDDIRQAAEQAAVDVVIGTVSHCHGALTRLAIGAPLAPADSHNRYI